MNRSGMVPVAAAARGVLGTASHGQASTMGCHWFLAASVRASTVHTLVIAAIPPVRSTLIFMAWSLGSCAALRLRNRPPGHPVTL